MVASIYLPSGDSTEAKSHRATCLDLLQTELDSYLQIPFFVGGIGTVIPIKTLVPPTWPFGVGQFRHMSILLVSPVTRLFQGSILILVLTTG